MADIKRYALAGGAVLTAAAIGFVMQNGGEAQERYAAAQDVPDISGTADDPLEVTDITLTSAVADTQAARVDAPEEKPLAQVLEEAGETQVAALGDTVSKVEVDAALAQSQEAVCDVSMSATPIAAALVDVVLTAPCYGNERVTIHHNGMMFTEATDASGTLNVTVPALTSNAVFIAAFASGEGALANAKVETLEYYDRKVLQSKYSAHLHINAFEFGADYRQTGHVKAGSQHDMSNAAKGEAGFVISLGDTDIPDALVAEVYTYPTATSKNAGDIHVSVDAEVTTANCGLQMEAQTLEVTGGGAPKVQDLTLPYPSCDAVGDYVVLQNLLQDLTIASN